MTELLDWFSELVGSDVCSPSFDASAVSLKLYKLSATAVGE